MNLIEFLRPTWFLIVPAALVVIALWWLWRRRQYVAFAAVSLLERKQFGASAARRLPIVVWFLAIICIAAALAEPVLPETDAELHSLGLDIVLVLDLSSSMQETMGLSAPRPTMQRMTFTQSDSAQKRRPMPTRLDVTKAALSDFVKRRNGDRLGLVVFSDHAYVVSPPTFDYEYLQHYIGMVDDQILRGEGMTAIGDGIGLANYLLSRQQRVQGHRQVVVVFTDGEHNFGRDPIEALAESNDADIRVHVVGVDIEEDVRQKPAVRNLVDTVRKYGGRYYDASTAGQLFAINATLDTLEKSELVSKVQVRNEPVFYWFALPAIGLVILGLAIRMIPYFTDVT